MVRGDIQRDSLCHRDAPFAGALLDVEGGGERSGAGPEDRKEKKTG